MEEYQSNSHKSKEALAKKVEKPVVTGARTKKKSELRKLADIFIPDDVESVRSYILLDVIVPLIKKGITSIVDVLLYGEARSDTKKDSASRVSYRSYYENRDRDDRGRGIAPKLTDVNIIVDSRAEAESIISGLEQIIDVYGFASVADMCDLADLEHNFTDNKYGWTSVKTAKIIPRRDGWEIEMPKRMPIDNN